MNQQTASYLAYTVGSRIFARRQDVKLTQDDLAERTGIKAAAISHYECGRRRPGLKNLLLICDALECTPDDLLLEPKP